MPALVDQVAAGRERATEEDIRVAIVVKVGEECSRRVVLHIEAVLGRMLGERAVAAIVQQHVPTSAHGKVQVVVPIGVDIHDADAGMAIKGLAREIAVRCDKRGVAKRLEHQGCVARNPSLGGEHLVEGFGKECVRPREHLQRFGRPAQDPPSRIVLLLPLQHQPSPNLRAFPAFCLRRGVKAQASLVDRGLRVEEMPGLKVEGRIVAPIQRGPERSPQRDVGVVN